MSSDQTINLPQLLVLTVIGFLAIRWLFSTRTPNAAAQGRNASSANRVNPAHVEQILQMFPQLDRRTVMWELQRNGGSVAMVTEKILTGRALEIPPPSFQPPMPATPPSAAARPAPSQPKSTHPDLITKYNLASRLNESPNTSENKGKQVAWSSNKEERQSLLQKRREEMILAARRKLEERDRAAAAAAAASAGKS
ncbi:uncharacterized protein PV09_05472 [Verruconis gallopava]|uniref:CUE domain-containing protein n=1 Tax=Verruconis gallopava TaxID=253628 RepID=A0A0D1XLE9_9PEZI|nr:uncharacterized protein PV09_05472 [Verruconis gallopava]KIW03251.1 hypothetical protein PV09_05472 [Verruconis gallopava]